MFLYFIGIFLICKVQAQPLEFHLKYDSIISSKPVSGRVYVMLQSDTTKEPRFGPGWINTQPFFAIDIKNWKPGEEVILDNKILGHPVRLEKLPRKKYAIQAVLDINIDNRDFSVAPGNGYSNVMIKELNYAKDSFVTLIINNVVPEKEFEETQEIKEVNINSELLSSFYERQIKMKAAVLLPSSYKNNPNKFYPTVYIIPGFGGTYHYYSSYKELYVTGSNIEKVYVLLDPDCSKGHHVFADSDNNGPRGKALIEELIPYIEKEYRVIPEPSARLLTGHSSGGWSSLWLQITYPGYFGGVWSTAPDPVDFRDFQKINIYNPSENMFVDNKSKNRPIARFNGKPAIYYKQFSDLEIVIGDGGQLHSFEAVFSPRGVNGQPMKLWDRNTGEINQNVAKHWEKYDIRLQLERNWSVLEPELSGKLHVYMGKKDNFYLEGAVKLLKKSLRKLGSDAKIELFNGRDHSTLLDPAMMQRINDEMDQIILKNYPNIIRIAP